LDAEYLPGGQSAAAELTQNTAKGGVPAAYQAASTATFH